ncbi:hypothetical protein LB504_006874, partial [Fusarium proliferatum]
NTIQHSISLLSFYSGLTLRLTLPLGCLQTNSLKRAGSKQSPKKGMIACLRSTQALNFHYREGHRILLSPEKELLNMSSGVMPSSWDARSLNTTKTYKHYERDIEVRNSPAQHTQKESHHSREIFNILSSSGEAQPQLLRTTEPCPTNEKRKPPNFALSKVSYKGYPYSLRTIRLSRKRQAGHEHEHGA